MLILNVDWKISPFTRFSGGNINSPLAHLSYLLLNGFCNVLGSPLPSRSPLPVSYCCASPLHRLAWFLLSKDPLLSVPLAPLPSTGSSPGSSQLRLPSYSPLTFLHNSTHSNSGGESWKFLLYSRTRTTVFWGEGVEWGLMPTVENVIKTEWIIGLEKKEFSTENKWRKWIGIPYTERDLLLRSESGNGNESAKGCEMAISWGWLIPDGANHDDEESDFANGFVLWMIPNLLLHWCKLFLPKKRK